MPRTQAEWFDRNAFVVPASGHWGDAGRGIIEGPGYIIFSLGLQEDGAARADGRHHRGGMSCTTF